MATVERAERALRADAQRNRERIMAAAREVFAAEGHEASVAEIAERAGVGTATIFRRFPTKEDLFTAVVEERVRELVASAREALAMADPVKALRSFMRTAVEGYIGDRGFCEASATDTFATPTVSGLVDELVEAIGGLLARAQQSGAIRQDVSAADIPVLLMAVSQAGLTLEPAAPGVWRRYLDLVIDGLRPEGAHPLSRRAPSRRQLDAAKHGHAARPAATPRGDT